MFRLPKVPPLPDTRNDSPAPEGPGSLPEVSRSVPVPRGASPWPKLLACAGPGFLVSVGYMDPGNWATDLSGGARFGYWLLSVIRISNLIAILLQHLCVNLGWPPGATWPRPAGNGIPNP